MYKLVAIDLDGTMLNSYGEVTENTKRIIRNAIKRGIKIVIASGRSIDSILSIAEEIGNIKYIIAGNGAVLYDIEQKKILYEKYIPKEKALEIIKICEENSIYYNVYTNKSIIADSLRYNVLYYYKENLKKEEKNRTKITLVENIKKYFEQNPNEKIMKIFICDITKSIFNSILRKFEEIEDVDILDVSHMARKIIKHGTEDVPIEYYYTEISMENVDKWNAIKVLLDKYDIKKEEVITIGDNMNDKNMIENAGMGVIMKGSSPRVVEIADYVTDDNNHEGVAKAIELFTK